MILSTIILILAVLLLLYLLSPTKSRNSSIPLVTHGKLPIFGHLISFIRNRKQFLLECHRQYGQCFTLQLLTQKLTFILSPSDWPTIAKNSNLYLPEHELGIKIFDTGYSVIGES